MLNLLRSGNTENKRTEKFRQLNLLILIIFSVVTSFSTAIYAGPSDSLTPASGTAIDETEDNDTTPLDLTSYFDLQNDQLDVLVSGEISSDEDTDQFEVSVIPGTNLNLQLNLKSIKYNDITSLESADDFLIFVTDRNTIWIVDSGNVDLLLSDSDLADAIPELELADIVINDIWISDDNDILIAFDSVVYVADTDGNLELLYSAADITAATGVSSPKISTIATSETYVYIADESCLNILQGDLDGSALTVVSNDEDIAKVFVGNDIDLLSSYSELADYHLLQNGTFASTSSTFRPTHMIKVSGSSIYDDGFYCTQFSDTLNGTGGITQVSPDADDPNIMIFSQLMAADDDIINPTCLVEDTVGNFGNFIYMANFGVQMGNNFDGKVYKVDAAGTPTEFVTQYLNLDGTQATKGTTDPIDVTGFYDVIDMKFSNNLGSYGDYLYIISENIADGTQYGSDSDIWRIDSDGVAELFVEGVMPGAGRIIFDTVGTFGNQMIIVPWQAGHDFVTVDADGVVTTLYPAVSSNILSAEIAPSDSVFNGGLLLTVSGGDLVSLDYDPNNVLQTTLWTSDLPTGAIPGGDIVFDNSTGDMFLLAGDQSSKGILKYENYDINFDIADINVQETTYNTDNDYLHQPHFSVQFNDDFGILKVDNLLEEPTTSMVVSSGDFEEDDDITSTGFCFSNDGNCYIYSNVGKWVKISEWTNVSAALGSFVQLETLTQDEIAAVSSQEYPEIKSIMVSPADIYGDSYLYAITSNGQYYLPDSIDEIPSQDVDDDILYLGDLSNEDYTPSFAYGSNMMNRILVDVTGPEGDISLDVSEYADPNGVFEYELNSLEGGIYNISLSAPDYYTGSYDMLLENNGVLLELIIDEDNPESIQTLSNDQTVKFAIDGRGQVHVFANVNPDTGNITEIFEIEINGTNSGTVIDILNTDDPHNLDVKYITINDSVRSLTCHGTIEQIRTTSTKNHKLKNLSCQHVEEIILSKFAIDVLQLDSLGVKDEEGINGVSDTKTNVIAKYIREIDVNEDVSNVDFFQGDYSNKYKLIDIDGVVVGSRFYGHSIREFIIGNKNSEDTAFYESACYTSSYIRELYIYRGDISNSSLVTQRGYIRELTVQDGNISDAYIVVGNSSMKKLVVNGSDLNQNNGNVDGSTLISADANIDNIYIKGDFAKTCEIDANNNIKEIIIGGQCAGRIEVFRLKELLVGYDIKGKRLQESGDFTGSDYTGDLLSTLDIKEIKITGQMRDDNTGESNIVSTYGNIKNLYIEDNARGYVYAGKDITTIMVGLIDGKRKHIANEDAEVHLDVNARSLKRLYYTGTRDEELTLPGNPVIYDVNP